jgi:hypothetical protein
MTSVLIARKLVLLVKGNSWYGKIIIDLQQQQQQTLASPVSGFRNSFILSNIFKIHLSIDPL